MSSHRNTLVPAAILLAAVAGAPASEPPKSAAPPQAAEPLASDLEEHVDVRLVEIVVRISDRRGRAVDDVRPEELRVTENGKPRRLAYLTALAAGGAESAGQGAPVSTLYDRAGQPSPSAPDIVVKQPRSQRRVFFVFDPFDSKRRTREKWTDAVMRWVDTSAGPDDRVALVVLRRVVDWVQTPTSDKSLLLEKLGALSLEGYAPDRDRREEMSSLMEDLEACASSHRAAGALRRDDGGERSQFSMSQAQQCAVAVTEPWAEQWNVEAAESVAALRAFVGQLAAIGGRKDVVLFSEGIIPDSGSLATNALIGIFGVEAVHPLQMRSRFGRDVNREVDELQATARAAGAVIHVFDTRSAADRGYYDQRQYASAQGIATLGINPWAEMYEATDGMLAALAGETGGRIFRGTDDLPDRIGEAASSYFGAYNLGFYRDTDQRPGKLRIAVARKGVRAETITSARRPWVPQPGSLELFIRPPQPGSAEDSHSIPVLVELPLGVLPLRKEGGSFGCVLGIFVQAVRPDGSVAGEVFRDATVALAPDDPARDDPAAKVRQMVYVEVPAGSYRLLVRVSDDRQRTLTQRSVDLTLSPTGEIRGGLEGS